MDDTTPTPDLSSGPEGSSHEAPDLKPKLETIRALATINNLLVTGHFQITASPHILQSVNFLKSWHEKLVSEALKHPEAESIDELKPFFKTKETK